MTYRSLYRLILICFNDIGLLVVISTYTTRRFNTCEIGLTGINHKKEETRKFISNKVGPRRLIACTPYKQISLGLLEIICHVSVYSCIRATKSDRAIHFPNCISSVCLQPNY